ncbi:mechanosensitive ion channel family protein [Halopenitus sp. POP-27]|uniref:mechanosensitive ion channel family protein n=1 Tax=Halopenitus sp. POP-27 TaxID=2994425 RepID=UPI0024697671|nr:mechanosensitive ion channel family protein [Halopenitus sp. POP-27]
MTGFEAIVGVLSGTLPASDGVILASDTVWPGNGQVALGPLERAVASAGVVAVVVVVRFLVRRYRSRQDGDLGTTKRLTLSSVIAASTAAGVLTVVGLWGLGDQLVAAYGSLELAEQVPNIVLAVIVLGGAYALTDFFGQIIREVVSTGKTVSTHQKQIIYRLTQLAVYSLAGLIVIGLFTDNLGNLLVGAGFLGIVVGMAARQTLGSVLAGIVLMFSRPFEIGDWIEFEENEGTVTEITVFHTRIQTFDGEYVTIPNDRIANNPIIDRSRKGRLRIEVEVGIDYDDDPDHAADVAQEAMADLDDVRTAPRPKVVAKRFGDSSVVLGARFWIDQPSARKRWRTQTAVISALHDAFRKEGITIPFPQRTHGARSEGLSVTVGSGGDAGSSGEAAPGGNAASGSDAGTGGSE